MLRRAFLCHLSLVAIFGLSISTAPTLAFDYEVGPGKPYTSIGAVPWADLQPGDRVLIHWRPEPYREKWIIAKGGAESNPVVVRGIRSPDGLRPVVDAREAVTAPGLDYELQEAGVIHVTRAIVPFDPDPPTWIEIEGLEVRSGRAPNMFFDNDGTHRFYSENTSAIRIAKAAHIVVRDCELYDSGNGLLVQAGGGFTRDVLVERNYIHDNGWVGQPFAQNLSIQGIGRNGSVQSHRSHARWLSWILGAGCICGTRSALQLDRGRGAAASAG